MTVDSLNLATPVNYDRPDVLAARDKTYPITGRMRLIAAMMELGRRGSPTRTARSRPPIRPPSGSTGSPRSTSATGAARSSPAKGWSLAAPARASTSGA